MNKNKEQIEKIIQDLLSSVACFDNFDESYMEISTRLKHNSTRTTVECLAEGLYVASVVFKLAHELSMHVKFPEDSTNVPLDKLFTAVDCWNNNALPPEFFMTNEVNC